MGKPLRVLLVEDCEDDAELTRRALRRHGYDVTSTRVHTGASLESALEEPWDVVLCDYTLPELDAPRALGIVRGKKIELPLIVVSGTIGEEPAVEVMRLGASDYLLKGNLARLGYAVARSVDEATIRAERRLADQAFRELEASFRRIIERSPELIVIHRDGVILYANHQATMRIGSRVEELVGMSMGKLVAHTGTSEDRWSSSEGSSFPVEVVNVDILFEGKPAIVAIGRDLTERNRVATAMVEVERLAAVGLLCAAVGHEINNPLAYVLANLEYIGSEVDAIVAELPEAAQEKFCSRLPDLRLALDDTVHGARRVRDIVQDLRTFSRSGADHAGVVDVRTVLESSLRMARVQVSQRAKVNTFFHEVPLVKGDESRLGQVFLNLLINASQAMSEGMSHTIDVTTSVDGAFVVVKFADSGPGIPPDVLPRIFEPFFTTKPTDGTGLGLPISDRIVRELGGEITVESSPAGSTFYVRLPANT